MVKVAILTFTRRSLHLSQAILCHFFQIDMNWGATAKEVEQISFGKEVVKIFRRFRGTFVFCLAATMLMILTARIW